MKKVLAHRKETNMSNEPEGDFEYLLDAILEEATDKDPDLCSNRIRDCYEGLCAARADLDFNSSEPEQYKQVLTCYVQLRCALDGEI
jgi:hypothetical protein